MYAEDIERYKALMDLLTEIRDRLFGYARGSGKVPDENQLACARAFLDGSMFHDGIRTPLYPKLAWEIAREIVRMGKGSTGE